MNTRRLWGSSLLLATSCSASRVPVPQPHVDPEELRRMAPVAAPPRPREPLRVVELRNEASTLVTFRVVLHAGSADDPQGRDGLTRLLVRLMTEGGTQALPYEDFTRRLFPMAATLRYEVDRDMTVITAQVHRDHATAFYPLLRDVILTPRLGASDFERVRTQSLADLRLELRGSSDETLGKEVLQSLVYEGHPYGHPPVGTERALEAATVDDVRAHHRNLFCTTRMSIGLAGAYPAALVDTVRGDMATLPEQCAATVTLPTPTRPHGLHVIIVDKPTASATAISLGFPLAITRRDDDFPAVQLATNHLGLHRQSVGVLYQTLREARGLNYGDYAYAEHFEQEPGTRFPRPNVLRRQQYASVWIRPVPARAGHFALRAALRAVDRVVREGVSQDDLTRVRGFLDGYVGLYTQTESARLGYALDDVITGWQPGGGITRLRERWSALTVEGVRDATQRHLTAQDAWVAIIAPDAQALAQALGANAPSPITYETPKSPEVMAEDREISVYPLALRPEDVRVVPLAEVFR